MERVYRWMRIIALTLVTVSLLAGCGTRGEGEAEATAAPPTATQPVAPSPQATPSTAETKPAPTHDAVMVPNFSLESIDGKTVTLRDYKGKIILINFWASWCPPCQAEMPSLEAYYRDHKDDGFIVLAVNHKEPQETVAAFAEKMDLTFPVLLDTDGSTAQTYGVTGMPTSFFVGRDGELLGYWPGALTQEMLEQGLTPVLLKSKQP